MIDKPYFPTGFPTLDRVMGGGLPRGSLMLVCGDGVKHNGINGPQNSNYGFFCRQIFRSYPGQRLSQDEWCGGDNYKVFLGNEYACLYPSNAEGCDDETLTSQKKGAVRSKAGYSIIRGVPLKIETKVPNVIIELTGDMAVITKNDYGCTGSFKVKFDKDWNLKELIDESESKEDSGGGDSSQVPN